MNFLWRRKRSFKVDAISEQQNETVEETQLLKSKAHQTAAKTDRDIRKLNDLLKANGITLKIHIASGGHHGR